MVTPLSALLRQIFVTLSFPSSLRSLILIARRDIFVLRVIGFTAARISATGIGILVFPRRSLLTTYDLSGALARSLRRSDLTLDHFGPVSLLLSRHLRYLLYQLASRT